ncbi:MAG: MBL fold metallo-hydrolase [Eubacteriales bacterium]|nr:MBL fold metallo-hydrolase [Eubacteriales bacterium]
MSFAQSCSLASSSKGNSIFLRSGDTRILIDAGISCARIESSLTGLGERPEDLNAILVTHEHSDHVSGLLVFARRYNLPVYLSEGSYRALLEKKRAYEQLSFHIVEASRSYALGNLSFRPFRLSHDAAEPFGYRIDTGHGSLSVLTDCGEVSSELFDLIKGSKRIYLESNYDPEMLHGGRYSWALKKRIEGKRGHLSNFDAAALLIALVESGTERIQLSHLSEENNRPELAYTCSASSAKLHGICLERDLKLTVSPAHRPSLLEDIC